jgi:hypothetical protein
MVSFKQDRFVPKNYKKYAGDPTNIFYRSGWERDYMQYIDDNSSIVEWQSEEFFIAYYNPIKKRMSRYFPDFLLKIKGKDGRLKTVLIEIKPEKQTQLPKGKKNTRKYIVEAATYAINLSKWRAAYEYCQEREWDFKVVSYDRKTWKYHNVDKNFLLQS